MKHTYRLLALLAAIVMTVSLWGCGGTATDESDTSGYSSETSGTSETKAKIKKKTAAKGEETTPTEAKSQTGSTEKQESQSGGGRRASANCKVEAITPDNGETVEMAHKSVAAWLSHDYTPYSSKKYCNGLDNYKTMVTLKWQCNEKPVEYNIAYGTSKDLKGAKTDSLMATTYILQNLMVDTDYYWQVTAVFDENSVKSPIYHFHTEKTIRTIFVNGVSNIRDLGGRKTLDGKTVKQGMIFRGAHMDGAGNAGLRTIRFDLGVKTDLDLRDPASANDASPTVGKKSPLDGANYICYTNAGAPQYWGDEKGINSAKYKATTAAEVRVFAKESNYPIYFHCRVGLDRTGTLAFLIEALLGMSEDDICIDYEMSFLSSVGGTSWLQTQIEPKVKLFNDMMVKVRSYSDDGTLKNGAENFLKSIGITQAEIDSIRKIMLK